MIEFWTDKVLTQSTVLDFGTLVPHEYAAHCFDPNHQPRFWVKDNEGHVVAEFDTDVLAAVRFTHEARQGYLTLVEDGYPVFTCLS